VRQEVLELDPLDGPRPVVAYNITINLVRHGAKKQGFVLCCRQEDEFYEGSMACVWDSLSMYANKITESTGPPSALEFKLSRKSRS
jgi:hypothetical protein